MLGSSSLALSFNLCGRGDCSFLSVVGKVKVFLKTGAIPTDFERLSATKRNSHSLFIRTSSKKEKNSSGKAGDIRVQTLSL